MQNGPVQILSLCVDQLHCLMSSRVHVQPPYRLSVDFLLHMLDLHAMHRGQCVAISLSMHNSGVKHAHCFDGSDKSVSRMPNPSGRTT